MKYGYFDDKAREYVITNPRTPWPWINYPSSVSLVPFPLLPNSLFPVVVCFLSLWVK